MATKDDISDIGERLKIFFVEQDVKLRNRKEIKHKKLSP